MAVMCTVLLEESIDEYVKFIIYRLYCVSICNQFLLHSVSQQNIFNELLNFIP